MSTARLLSVSRTVPTVQLHGTLQSIVTVLTLTRPHLFFHLSSSPASLIQVIDKGRSRLLWLLCFFLFMLLILYLLRLFVQQGACQVRLRASDVALCKAVKCHASNVCTHARHFACNCSVRRSQATLLVLLLRAMVMLSGARMDV